jgi:AcrR family transcriptional regulator
MATVASAKTAPSVQLGEAPAGKGERTRERLLDLAYDSIVAKGFAATSIEELVAAAGMSKSGFFYHFKDKNDLARQLLLRYIAENEEIMDGLEARARELSEDPLHAFLIFLKLWAEVLEEMLLKHPGCLVASVTYQDASFDSGVSCLTREAMLLWRARFQRWIEEISARHPPRVNFDPVALADHINVVADGAIVLSKSMKDVSLMARQTMLMRDMVRLMFGG